LSKSSSCSFLISLEVKTFSNLFFDSFFISSDLIKKLFLKINNCGVIKKNVIIKIPVIVV
tara:strand:- start:777 stop:956 length:180 start_codon:yes stop_codon:yes gene_type:complete